MGDTEGRLHPFFDIKISLDDASTKALVEALGELEGVPRSVIAWSGEVKVFENGRIEGAGACKEYRAGQAAQDVTSPPVGKVEAGAVGEYILMGGRIPWSSQLLRRVASLIEQGVLRGTVKNKQEAQELYLGLFHSKGVRNAEDFNSTSAKDFFQRFNVEQGGTILENYYHWDDIFEFRRFDTWSFTNNINGVPTTTTRALTQGEISQIRQVAQSAESSQKITSQGAYVLKNHDPFTDADSFVPHLQVHFRATPDRQNGIFEGKICKIFFK